MITIDRLSFDFVATDEPFANNLYANWDSFCQHYFEKVVEESLSRYDQETVIREFERLDLDLGVITQDDFYREFPKRLKEEILRITQYWGTESVDERQKSAFSRLENILFYLEHGYTLEIWGGASFSLSKEIQWAFGESEAYIAAITKLCIDKGYVLYRLAAQVDDSHLILKMYAGVLTGTYSQNEKQVFLEMFLDINPGIPVRFVHETGDEASLHSMSELLNTHSVRLIMKTETEEHAEVDLPPYWHYLYEWLVQYYPFNGLAVFGSKGDFVQHLHFCLLTYIHKRNYAYYLSKAELTLTFLKEVFGPIYFKEVLNAIYMLQPHHKDGTPVYDGYLNRELYKVFMMLSLLKLPSVEEKKSETTANEETSLLSKMGQGNLPLDIGLFSEFLQNSRYTKADKQYALGVLSIERADTLRFWLENGNLRDKEITDIAEIMDWTFILNLNRAEIMPVMKIIKGAKSIGKGIDVRKLKELLADDDMPDSIKQRLVLLFFERFKEYDKESVADSFETAILLLYRHGILDNSLSYVNSTILEVIIHSLISKIGLIRLLFQGQIAHHDNSIMSSEETINEAGLLLNMLSETNIFTVSDFREWNNMTESRLKAIQRLIKDKWNTADGLSEWLEDSRVSTTDKSGLITTLAIENPHSFVKLLRTLPNGIVIVKDLSVYIPYSILLQGLTCVNFHQASLLAKIATLLKQKSADFPILVGTSAHFSSTLSLVLLLYIQDSATLGVQMLSDKEVLHKMMSYMCFIYTGKMDYHADSEWRKLEIGITEELRLDESQLHDDEETIDVLHDNETNDVIFGHTIVFLLENNPSELLTFIETNADSVFIKRMAILSDITILNRWSTYLITVPGFDQADRFRQVMMWLCTLASNHTMTAAITEALLFWIKDNDWKKQSAEQIEDYFIKRLFGVGSMENDLGLSAMEMLTDENMPLTIRKNLVQNYIHMQPKKLLDYIRVTVKRNTQTIGYWTEWINSEGWISLAASQSILQAEKLRQIMEYLSAETSFKKEEIEVALATVVLDCYSSEQISIEKDVTVNRFMQALPHLNNNERNSSMSIQNTLEKVLSIDKEYVVSEEVEDEPDYLFITNAGLCLLSPWFPRLFDRLGYLNEEKMDFKDTPSRIRAVFVLQYLVCPEERNFSEVELAFNRILVSLRMNVPLPKQLGLTDEEKLSADSMVSAVKAYWPKMSGTSLKGFRQSFISRGGRLEQQNEKWILTVDDKVYDVILDTVPWSFKQIRYHWLKKYIQVLWYEKEEFSI